MINSKPARNERASAANIPTQQGCLPHPCFTWVTLIACNAIALYEQYVIPAFVSFYTTSWDTSITTQREKDMPYFFSWNNFHILYTKSDEGEKKGPWQYPELLHCTGTSSGIKSGSVERLMSFRRHSPGWQWHIQRSVEQHWTTSEQSGKSVSALGRVCHNLVALRISEEETFWNRWLSQIHRNRERKQTWSHEREEFTERGWRFSSKISKSILPSVSLKRKKNIAVSLPA